MQAVLLLKAFHQIVLQLAIHVELLKELMEKTSTLDHQTLIKCDLGSSVHDVQVQVLLSA